MNPLSISANILLIPPLLAERLILGSVPKHFPEAEEAVSEAAMGGKGDQALRK
jgi:hypothetical protein